MTKAVQTTEIVGIQYLRAIAAIAVLYHHAMKETRFTAEGRAVPEWVFSGGAAGVDLFFVISGFIMIYVSFPRDRPVARPLKFLARRATRVFPFYWACCLLVIAMGAVGLYSAKDFSPGAIAYSLALLPYSKLLGVSWTLSYELFFYLFFAVSLLSKNSIATAISTTALIAVTFVVSLVTLSEGTARTFLTNPVLFEFACGLAIGLAYLHYGKKVALPIWAGLVGAAILMIAPAFVETTHLKDLGGWTRFVFWGLPAAIILMAFLDLGTVHSKIGKLGELLGDASYAIYLTHPILLVIYGWGLRNIFQDISVFITAPAFMLAAIIGGLLAHLVVEKPVLKVTRRLFALRLPQAILAQQSGR